MANEKSSKDKKSIKQEDETMSEDNNAVKLKKKTRGTASHVIVKKATMQNSLFVYEFLYNYTHTMIIIHVYAIEYIKLHVSFFNFFILCTPHNFGKLLKNCLS